MAHFFPLTLFFFSIALLRSLAPSSPLPSTGAPLRFGNPRASPEAAAGCRSSSRRWSNELLQRGAAPARDRSRVVDIERLLVRRRPPPPSPSCDFFFDFKPSVTLDRRRVPPRLSASRHKQEPRQAPNHHSHFATPLLVEGAAPQPEAPRQPARRARGNSP